MSELIQALIDALREELQQYGELLARLDDQQECVILRATDRLLSSVESVQIQTEVVQAARKTREQRCQEIAPRLGLPTGVSCAQLATALPDSFRPLVEALVQENNDLLIRLRQRARQNHLMLNRSLELMQQVLGAFCNESAGPVYGNLGAMRGTPRASSRLCELVA